MWLTSLLRSVQRRSERGLRPARNSKCKGRSFLPRLEALEDRTALSTLTVLNAADKGAGSLRDAIGHAHDGDTVVFHQDLSGEMITLTSGALDIKNSLEIEGPGASLLSISGNDTSRVFDIGAGLTVTIAGLTITHGRAVGSNGGGGILNVASTLTVANAVLSYNQALGNYAAGGAIRNLNGATLTVTDSSFLGNQVIARDGGQGLGGAIENGVNGNSSGSSATIIGSTFTGNQAVGGDGGEVRGINRIIGRGSGGGIFNEGGSTLTVVNSTFTRNQAIAGNGGSGGKGAGLYFVGTAGGGAIGGSHAAIVSVSGSTFAYNQAIGGSHATGGSSSQGFVGTAGGGALLNTGLATVTNSTFVGNEALGGSGNGGGSGLVTFGRAAGGAISNAFFSTPVSLTLSGCTLTNNRAVGGAGNKGGVFSGNGIGGGLANQNGASATVMYCTIVDNRAFGGAGGVGGDGSNGFGGGIFNDGLSTVPTNAGASTTLTLTGTTITGNTAAGGVAGASGGTGLGKGGGVYLAAGGFVCLDDATLLALAGNLASTSNDDVFGAFTIC